MKAVHVCQSFAPVFIIWCVFIQGKCAETGLFLERERAFTLAADRSHWTSELDVFYMV